MSGGHGIRDGYARRAAEGYHGNPRRASDPGDHHHYYYGTVHKHMGDNGGYGRFPGYHGNHERQQHAGHHERRHHGDDDVPTTQIPTAAPTEAGNQGNHDHDHGKMKGGCGCMKKRMMNKQWSFAVGDNYGPYEYM